MTIPTGQSPLIFLLCCFGMLFILLSIISTFIYYLKVVQKIDKIVLSHGIDRDQFDQGYLRFTYYKKAVFKPDFFTEKRKYYIFDPKIIEGKITPTDKKIMKLHTFLYRAALVFLALLVIAIQLKL
ncbi:hypothetical protein MSP8886_00326 [Marinomonas spartinae]|uniref:Uncharacterized protein n=1 Tax=Marinomonas spartinae TaxID=1792290 RepID=A0A1A8T1Q0_9GAMM|nr:hypothetical protein [Marinomonas spartinae]SBS25604.1 hypothetical protein MSP8886_00326 [Marinomonas spartinae]